MVKFMSINGLMKLFLFYQIDNAKTRPELQESDHQAVSQSGKDSPRPFCPNLASLERGQCRSLSGIHRVCLNPFLSVCHFTKVTRLSGSGPRMSTYLRVHHRLCQIQLACMDKQREQPASLDRRAWQEFPIEWQSGACQMLGDYTSNTLQLMISVPRSSQLAALQRFPHLKGHFRSLS